MRSSDILGRALELRAAHTPFVLATVVAAYKPQSVTTGAKAIVRADGSLDGWVGGGCVRPIVLREALEALGDGRPRLVRINAAGEPGVAAPAGVRDYPMTCHGEGGLEVYLEPVVAVPRLVVLGQTPVAQSLARLGRELELDVLVAAPAAAAPLFADVSGFATDPREVTAALDPADYVVVATMGSGDEDALEAAVRSAARYVAMVASRKKAEHLLAYLAGLGVPSEQLARVKCPAGLDLGGMRAPEIALSIVAEIVRLRYADGTTGAPAAEAAPRSPRRAAHGPERRRSIPLLADAAPAAGDFPIDPICGMPVDPAGARHTSTVDGRLVYFCCPHCKATFDARDATRDA